MKRIAFTSFLGLLLLSMILPVPTVAVTDGPSASGSFRISFEDGSTREINFSAKTLTDGSTSGEITLQDSPTKSAKKPVTEEEPAAGPFYAKADCDCLTIKGVEAVMSGIVKQSSSESYVGKRVLIVVQDGDSLDPPLRDKLSWGFYRTSTRSWVPVDAERPDEAPTSSTWVATDSERPDDVGVISNKSETIGCDTFPFSSLTFVGSKEGRGKIEVKR
ncbi:MAG TPA: hypothetical protein VJU86_02970 [Pyrinomonadaceae bacterium]|nr:hypothetical protein [Pyrinomonadaceae bacterium]